MRSRARSWALHLLYAWDLGQKDVGPAKYAEEMLTRRRMAPRYRPYSRELLRTVEAHLPEIDALIAEYAANWRLERIDVIDRNVLRLGVAELHWSEDVPPKVAIHEAVKLATRYGSASSSSFVNGVLDGIYKQVVPFE